MTYKEILVMVANACKYFYSGTKGHEDTVIQCATQIYIAQMNVGDKENEHDGE